jgi:hypothetical protein
MQSKNLRLLLIIVFLGVLSACSGTYRTQSAYYLIDPRFSELYERLQGEKVLGPPISNKKYVAGSNQEKQYFEGAVLVYDPDNSPRYYLDPIGLDAGFSDLPNNKPDNPGVRYSNGFIIPIEFSQFYDQMGGERWVGLPLTRARLNPEKNTIEQYFENMGFFRYEDDPPGVVHLMPYGLWKCAGECSKYPALENAGMSRTSSESLPSPFGEAISRFGTQFTGEALSSAFHGSDGRIEQIFQNVILYEDTSSPLGASLRPTSSLLAIDQDPYQQRNEESTDYFREIDDNRGFFIPPYFMDFIDQYFGFVISGEPISMQKEIREGVFQQCFDNYCLLYDSLAKPGQQVRILPLGQKYKDAFYQTANQPEKEIRQRKIVQLDIWEHSPQISSQEKQQIGACIHESGNPLINAQADISVSTNNQVVQTHAFLPTDNGGCSFIELDPIYAQNGTTVNYQVCFKGINYQDSCKNDSFLIWGNTDKTLSNLPGQGDPVEEPKQQDIVVDTWELLPQLSSSEVQEIGACIHANEIPQENLSAQLFLETPNSGVLTYKSSPTDGGGCSFFKLKPVNANNGETIPYQVCFTNDYGERTCKRDSFLIWGNP